ncbi:MAG: VCBS repeat-containing protein [Phycisphaerales bacterium]|nr:VCBS repeat-containing protein [Phycisphaerales bacterium]
MSDDRPVAARARLMLAVAGAGVPVSSTALAQIEFATPDVYLLAAGAGGVTIADMNNDGWSDVIANERIESTIVFLNQGDGLLLRFGSLYEPGAVLSQIRSADFDHDGNQDLVWIQTMIGQASLQIAYGRGDGRVSRTIAVSLPRAAGSITVADVTGDGWVDVIVADARGSSPLARVYRNERGTLVAGETMLLPWLDNVSLVSGDLDGDGDVDFAILSLDNIHDYMYGWKLDASEVRIFWNDGSGSFPTSRPVHLPFGGGGYGEDPMPRTLQVADLEGDGDLDLVVGAAVPQNPGRPVDVLTIEGRLGGTQFLLRDHHLVGSAVGETSIAAGDLDTDGDIDLLVKGSRDTWLLEADGQFGFEPARLVLSPRYSGAVLTLSDLDGDGRFDAVDGGAELAVYPNITPYNGPVLEHGLLKRGTPVTMTVTDAQPGEQVHFLYSLRGAGNSLGIWQIGMTLDLLDPIQVIGRAVADANGVAALTVNVPPSAPLTTVMMQSLIRRGTGGVDSVKTPFRTARITD